MGDVVDIVELTKQINRVARGKISDIDSINREATYLAINALIEAARAGEAGRGFAVVANQVKVVSKKIEQLTRELHSELDSLGTRMVGQLQHQEAQRLTDLALNMIDIIDRNLYERSCDVRWWATDSAVVQALEDASGDARAHASERLGVILDSYTVYLDLWVMDLDGNVVATGRPGKYPVVGRNVADESWFRPAVATRSGADYVSSEPEGVALLGGAPAAVYATAVREGSNENGRPIGVLAVFFDWAPQAHAVTRGVRLSGDEWETTRCLLVDSKFRVLASSDNDGVFRRTLQLKTTDDPETSRSGYYWTDDALIAFALTQGYETYKGMGWYGVIERKRSR
ncbi:methyl-accepting chemotaxis protein [Paraburkholderia caballeronis]|uniref:Methyl-accepting chemotaxis protein (MCP) signalling domain-containing protein n=1 Tax=Paraburkholderia caballeronis TaxID=416943 RepID=A0A1H7T7C0_9BURK|nr:methyl-accepting chemotaxis protein [Paraburkholderia caballeronis]PXW22734.1 methyl-accepting chemotaxis protein (MCP) signaling protein [Paraburkholderia caballeronis]PXW96837.1 methyl-accepting chemotaxis protein (MCP) signaling protein [Paraburkholderia caballeronis]RAJ93464.1 methyl-accepting chemotaxis protein (MCP) signaling protein [Paraburkholderia caballeronis]TDV12187.1 methyl-accepting chemotaxis protein (MCP) signaling protein [Paraburkholderia caballeronis]TDV15262.1 methyl-ac